MAVRVSLTERMSIEGDGVLVDDQRFPGRQGRLVFAYLLAAHRRAVPKEELADALWGDDLPSTWEKSLSVLVSKLRGVLNESGVDGSRALTSAAGCYALVLPEGSWIDVAAAEESVVAAEHALSDSDVDGARSNATTAASLARRTFLPGEVGGWVEERRASLREILVRALDCLAEASIRAGDPAAAARAAAELTALEPFREHGYRLLMQAQLAAGNDAEALRTYERCRRILSEELGAYPSPETEGLYLEILRRSPARAPAEVESESTNGGPPAGEGRMDGRGARRRRRWIVAAVAMAALLGVVALAAGVVATRGDDPPLTIHPTSVVRIDPDTLEPTQSVQIGPVADIVVAAGGYVWVLHGVFRYAGPTGIRDSGDRVLTRVDPSKGTSVVVGGGLAPCGLTADPSGDVWVANCFVTGSNATVVRVDADTLYFEKTIAVPRGKGFFRGLAYGGGSLWVADPSGAGADYHGITEVDPETGSRRRIELDRHAGWLAWSDGYGDLWSNDFSRGSVSRVHPETGGVKTYHAVSPNPGSLVAEGGAVWVDDWNAPIITRIPAIGSGDARQIRLPSTVLTGTTGVASGAGAVWAAMPNDKALFRIDPKTEETTRIELPYYPWGVSATNDAVWVSLRAVYVP